MCRIIRLAFAAVVLTLCAGLLLAIPTLRADAQTPAPAAQAAAAATPAAAANNGGSSSGLCFLWPFCGGSNNLAYPPAPAPQYAAAAASAPADFGYQLGPGDQVRVIVFGEDELGGQFEVDGSGFLRLPLIGQVTAAGLSVRNFEIEIEGKLRGDYLKDPRVNVEVTKYRPFFIAGEVNKPGEYPCGPNMTVPKAISLAGGYTYRANQDFVQIQRNREAKEERAPADQTTIVGPGDVIRVTERFF